MTEDSTEICSMSENSPVSNERIWTQDRLKVCDKLRQLHNDSPAQLYTRIDDLLKVYFSSSPTGRVDLALIGHCVRELMNGLSEYLDGTNAAGNNRAAEQSAIDRIRQVLFDNYGDSSSIAEAAEVVPISSELANALGQFMDAAREGSNSNKKRASLMVLGCVDEGNPALIPWFDVHSYFYKYVHINRGGSIELPDRDEVNRELSYLDNALSSRLGLFFDTKSKLVKILNNANAKIFDGSYLPPTDELIESALSLIANSGLRFVFFSELENPEWRLPLKQREVFKGGAETDFRALKFTSWPEKLYLLRVASIRPKLVSEIMLEASNVRNPVIRLSLIEIMLSLPIEETFEMASKVLRWAEQECNQNGYFWVAEEVSSLIRRLLTSDDDKARSLGKRLFQSRFMPRMAADGFFFEVNALIPRYFYSKGFDNLSDAYQQIPLSARRGMLGNFLIHLLPKSESGTPSFYFIPSIESEIERRATSISGEVFFQSARVILESLNNNSAETVTWLEKNENNPLLTRCVFFVLQAVLKGCSGDGGCVIDEHVTSYMHNRLLSGLILEAEYDPELYPLLSAALENGIIDSEEVDNLIQDSYNKKIEFYQVRYEELGNPDSENAVKAAKRWVHRTLSLIGPDRLGDTSKQFFSELCKEISQKEYSPMHVGEVETKVGPISPIGSSQMIDMGADSLLDYLIRWHPTQEDSFNLISHRGQAEELKKVVVQKPSFFTSCSAEIELLRPTYQQAILDGWGEALKDKAKDVPISNILTMFRAVSEMSETETWEPEGGSFDDDANYLGVRRAAARLAANLLDCSNVALSEAQANQLLATLIELADSSEPNAEYEQKYGGDNEDPLTLAMNTIKPIALLDIAKWIVRNAKNSNIQNALSVLEDHFPHKSQLLSEAAAIGEALPILYRVIPEWLEANYAKLFGAGKANSSQQVVLTTVLALFRPSSELYSFLSPALLEAMDNHAELYTAGFRSLNRDCLLEIGDWAYRLLVFGYISLDDPVLRKWQSVADDKHLGLVLDAICGMLDSNNGDIADEIVYRVGRLWDYHKKNLVRRTGNKALRGIVHLVKSGCFDVSWWGPRLLSELEINENKIPLVVIDEHLLALSEYDSELAVRTLQKIAERDHFPHVSRYSDIGLQLLQKAKFANGGTLTDAAQNCIDYLGALGCLDLDEKLL